MPFLVMLSFIFCVVRYKGDWTKAYHYAAVLLAESRWSKVKTFDIYHARASKVALLCHFAREVAIVGELDDLQLELLADHSFRFIQESTEEWIEKNGGWVSTWCSVFCTTL